MVTNCVDLVLLAHYSVYSSLVFCHLPGQTAVELARDSQMQQVLCVRPVRQLQKSATRFEGQLLKRSRFLGWKPIWVSFTFGFCHLSFLLFSLPAWWLLDHMRYNNIKTSLCPSLASLSSLMQLKHDALTVCR